MVVTVLEEGTEGYGILEDSRGLEGGFPDMASWERQDVERKVKETSFST